MQTRWWTALAAAVLTLALVGGPALAADASASAEPAGTPPQVLAGENRIQVDGNARAVVVLPRAQDMAPYAETVEVETAGRLAALVLVERGRVGRAVLFFARANQDELCGGACPGLPTGGTFGRVEHGVDATTIPAGTYDLYVVSPDGPATVTLRIPGSGGSTAIDTVAHDGVTFAEPENRSPLSAVDYHAGADGVLHGQGLLFTTYAATGDLNVVSQYGDCVYAGGEPEVGAYAAGCPTAQDGSVFRHPYVTNDGFTTVLSSLVVHADPGVYGLGSYRTGASRITTHTTYAFWLTY